MSLDPSDLAATSERPKSTRKKGSNTNGKPNQADVEENSQSEEQQSAGENAETAEQKPADEDRSVVVELPIHTCLPGYASKNIDFDASKRQAAAAKVLWCSLSADGARCSGAGGQHPDGKTVESVTMGIRWLLDKVADAIEAETGKSLVDDFGLSF
jgi:hypothetical protein